MKNKAEISQYEYLSKDTFLCLKGYLALMVLVSHLYQFSALFSGTYFGSFLNLFGHYGVVGFIFLSGFGLFASYSSKGRSYILEFPKKRLIPFFLTYTFAIVIYTIYELIIKTDFSVMLVVKSFTVGGTIVSFGWYLQYTLWLYVAFFAVYVLKVNDKIKSVIMAVGVSAFAITAYFLGYDAKRYTITIVFLLGFASAYYKEAITKFIKKFWYVIFIMGFGLLLLEYKISVQDTIPGVVKVLFSLLGDVSFVSIVLSATDIFTKVLGFAIKNPVSRFLGKYSLEIYIIQAMVLRIFVTIFENPWLLVSVSAVTIVAVAVIIHPIISLINKPFKKEKN